ncbi:hypothetical protein EST38_g11494 [Candolleomyces aberdarensis]|uniref:CHAT domain-containing protein n=1 Tax=Candolleomyces aberdarensis TaxID=2316362 RepID=A0A4Q2D704_9AGAR|nr:hypothetical protein EST38_g11494 [Candolleomyces aberdarensis]
MLAYRTSIELLPLAAGLDKTIELRHAALVGISELACEAVAFALQCGDPKVAVEWLEASRCLVWGQVNNLRTPVEDLRRCHGGLAERFSTVSAALERAGTREGPYGMDGTDEEDIKTTIALQKEAVAHVELAAEYETLLTKIRSQLGFEHFLMAPSFEDSVKNMPQSGYVIVVNVSKTACDAICFSPGTTEPLHVPLPDFSFDKAMELRNTLQTKITSLGLRTRSRNSETKGDWIPRALMPFKGKKADRDRGVIPGILKELWVSLVKPILDRLGIQLEAPGRTPIPGVTKEAQMVAGSLKEYNHPSLTLSGTSATVSAILQQLEKHTWLHFACHAYQDPLEPLQSGFFLHDGKLTISEIIKLDVKNIKFAYLSACQTSTGDENLSEEAVHLAAGMLAAGRCRGVVATMWSIRDQEAPDMAKDFYRYLLKHSKSGMDSSLTAYALDYAVGRLRDRVGQSDQDFLAWLPYVHFGA